MPTWFHSHHCRVALAVVMAALSTGCVTTTGTYVLAAQDENGVVLSGNRTLIATGSRIYSVRNALCMTYPKATVTIKNAETGEELTSESPHKCR